METAIEVVHAPDEESVQVDISPLFAFPPVVGLALFNIFKHRVCRGVLGDNVEEKRTPANHDLLLPEMDGEFKLVEGREKVS